MAVVAFRVLPLGRRALYGAGARLGGLPGCLALRHIIRRTGGVRTPIVLAMSFSLAAFRLRRMDSRPAQRPASHGHRHLAEHPRGAPPGVRGHEHEGRIDSEAGVGSPRDPLMLPDGSQSWIPSALCNTSEFAEVCLD